ncbi:MAG: hypothetical protein U0T84_02295 [Chitinophagales bacterium]
MLQYLEKKWVIVALIATLTYVIFGASLRHDYGLDDSYVLREIPNREVAFSDILKPFQTRFDFVDYRPIPVASFLFEKWLTGETNPQFSHGINLLLYMAICLLVFFTIKTFPIEYAHWLALATTFIFLAHPSHADVVNNLKSRDNLLSMLFGLSAVYVSLLQHPRLTLPIRWLLISLLLFLALISKLDAFGLVYIIPVIHLIFNREKFIQWLLLFVLLLAVYGLLRNQLMNYLVPITPIENPIVFTENPLVQHPGAIPALSMTISTLTAYLKLMVLPNTYRFYYGFNMLPILPITSVWIILQVLIHLSLLGLAVYQWRKNILITIGIAVFYLSLGYCANLFQPVAGILAVRYAFFASLGFCMTLAALCLSLLQLPWVQERLQMEKPMKKKSKVIMPKAPLQLIYVATAIMLFYAPFSYSRTHDWANIFTLLEADMPHLEQSFEANRIAATQYINRGSSEPNPQIRNAAFQRALKYSQQANQLCPDMIHEQESEGICYYMLGMTDSCFNHFARVRAKFDTTSVGWEMTGDIFLQRGQRDSAIKSYEKVLQLDRQNEQAQAKLNELNQRP